MMPISLFAAASLGVSPTTITLNPSQKTGTLTVINKGDKVVNLQLSAKSWDMDDNGKFIQTDTGDFVLYPKILTIAPHKQGNVRVGYMGKLPKVEKAYRLFVEEIPPIKAKSEETGKIQAGLSTILKLSMPLYVVPTDTIPSPNVELNGVKIDKKIFQVGVKNLTAHHLRVEKVTVKLFNHDTLLVEKSVTLKLKRILGSRQLFVSLPMDTQKFCQKANKMQLSIQVKNMPKNYETERPLNFGCQL
ncbi:MAG: molecular chaperone [Methylococcales bacterium]|nr:molecular chaperone [Methylococcales bacterium]